MPNQTGKGSKKRREAALTRGATQHHDFIGGADAERAESKFREHERLEGERKEDVVREMAAELQAAAGMKPGGASGPELRIPRSIDEGKRMIREAPEALRDKARERISKLPEPARRAIGHAETLAGFLFAPVRLGLGIASELFAVPMAMFRVLRHRES